jgi:hypothetical protein
VAGPYEVGLRSKNVFDCAPRGRSLATVIIISTSIIAKTLPPRVLHAVCATRPPNGSHPSGIPDGPETQIQLQSLNKVQPAQVAVLLSPVVER